MSDANESTASDGVGRLAQLPESRVDGKVMRGRDGWLFLDQDSNQFVKQQRGELLFTPEQLDQWQSLLEHRLGWFRGRGIPYHFLVAPNAHSVYLDKLPFDIPPETLRPVPQLIQHLEQANSEARLLYPLDQLRAARDQNVFTPTNSHWTDVGAFVAYQALMDEIGDEVTMRRLTESDLVFHEEMRPGDLGTKVDPVESSVHRYAMPRTPVAGMVEDNRVFLNGHRIDYECTEAPDTVCLIMGDSFAHMMLPFMAETFGRLTFAHISTLDRELVEEVGDEIVVTIMNERFMIQVPVDEGAKTHAQLAAEKRERGAIYPPRTKPGTRVDTPAPWKRDDAP
jgi:alginate O-acetyltransferase complex protein AlgJ